jgi:hypothetical protein
MKYCKFCQQNKNIEEFNKHPNGKNKLNSKCKQCIKNYRTNYNKLNKKNIIEYNIEYNQIYNKEWSKKNLHVIKWRGLLHRCLLYKEKKKNGKTENILQYSISKFKHHIESQFTEGMSWDNIHIDHKIPLTWFLVDTPPHIVNHLSNIQPLTPSENISKLNKYSHPIDNNYFLIIKEWIKPEYLNLIHTSPTRSQFCYA